MKKDRETLADLYRHKRELYVEERAKFQSTQKSINDKLRFLFLDPERSKEAIWDTFYTFGAKAVETNMNTFKNELPWMENPYNNNSYTVCTKHDFITNLEELETKNGVLKKLYDEILKFDDLMCQLKGEEHNISIDTWKTIDRWYGR